MEDPHNYEIAKKASGTCAKQEMIFPLLLSKLNWKSLSSSEQSPNILDYGCGAGSEGFKHILPNVIACDGSLYSVDISENMVKYAQENFAHEKVKYAAGDIINGFPFDNIIYDKIVSINVFHFFKDFKPALKNFYNILKPEGEFGFTFLPITSPQYKVVTAMANEGKWSEYMSDYEETMPFWTECKEGGLENHVRQYFVDAGFKWNDLKVINIDLQAPLEGAIGMIINITPSFTSVHSELQPKLRHDIRHHLTQMWGIPQDSQEINLHFDLITGIVQKS